MLIQCHKNVEHINKLIEYFYDDMVDVIIHVDKKSNIIDSINVNENVTIIDKRIDVRWGRFSQVEATLEMLKGIKNIKGYDYISLISGEDIPIKSLEYIKNKFCENKEIYLEYTQLPNGWPKKGLDRYQVYYPNFLIDRLGNKMVRILRVFYREFIMNTKIFKRKFNMLPNIYGGSSWFSIIGECAENILKFIENNTWYYNSAKTLE